MPLNKWLNSRDVIWQSGTEVPKGQALLARKKAKTGSFHFVECWTETLLLRLRTCNEPNGGWVSALVDLVDVEVLQPDAGALEHLRHRVGRRHQQAFGRAGEAGIVDRGRRGVREVRLDRDAARARPLLRAEQHARRAVGERRAVAGG